MTNFNKNVKQLDKQVRKVKQSKVISQKDRHRIEDIHEKRRLEKELGTLS